MAAKYEATDKERKQVEVLTALGLTHEQMAYVLDIAPKTLRKYYRPQIDDGKAKVDAVIGGKLVEKAMSGNLTAIIFYLKTKCGWQETNNMNVNAKIPVIDPKMFGGQ